MSLLGWLMLVAILFTGTAAIFANVNTARLRRPFPCALTTDEPVAVLLPVRNEADRVEPCLRAILAQQSVPGMRVFVYDDSSTDETAEIVAGICAEDPRVTLLRGERLPSGWLGKPHACQQLADAAGPLVRRRGALVFVDADVVLQPDAVSCALTLMDNSGADMLCPYPYIVAPDWPQRLVQPLRPWSWLSFLPLAMTEHSRNPNFAVGFGQFLLVRRAAYQAAGGHSTVRDQLVDDIGLARAMKQSGGKVVVADGTGLASCAMYTSWPKLVEGYTRTLWSLVGSLGHGIAAIVVLAWMYVLPPLVAIGGLLPGLPLGTGLGFAGLLAYGLGVLSRLSVAGALDGRRWPDALTHPAGAAILIWLMVRSYLRRDVLTWKGRQLGRTW